MYLAIKVFCMANKVVVARVCEGHHKNIFYVKLMEILC